MRLTTVPRHQQDAMTKIAVVALGGNALTRAGQSGSYDEMMANAAAMATAVNDVLEAGWRVVVVHGNGPQVGNLALQQEERDVAPVPAQPLALLGAMTQGLLGSVIARAIDLLRGRGTAAALVTHVDRRPGRSRVRRALQADRPVLRARRGRAAGPPRRLGGAAGLRPRLPPGGGLAAAARRDRDRGAARAGRRRAAGHRRGRRRDPGRWPRTPAGSWTRSSTRTGPPASSPASSAPRPCSWSPRWTG